MKREEVLFYINQNKIHLYFNNLKKEIIEDVDTSTFFKYSEISDVNLAKEKISEKVSKYFASIYLFKPDFFVLYNDITHCDLKYLYREILDFTNYNKINFIELSTLVKKINNSERVVVFAGDSYTYFKENIKIKDLLSINFDPILIGARDENYLYYSDENLIWNAFKSHFTNQ